MAGLLKNQVHTVTITGYSAEGLGVARIDGQVVFVHGGIRGEVCTVRILKVLKQLAFGRVEEILEESPARRAPDCPHFPACGGCALRHISYAEELDAKRQWVEDALRRVGGVETEVGILGADAVDGYRNKAIFPVSPAGQAGFYRARSHDVIPAVDCRLQTPQANAVAQAVEAYLREEGVPAYDERSGQGLLRHIYIRTSQAGRTLVCLAVNGASLPREAALAERIRRACPQVIGVVLNTNTRDTNVVLGDAYRTIWGEDTLTDTLCGLSVRLSVPSFYQVNRAQAERLYQKAVEFAGLTGCETVLELYCGAGTITMVMARHAARVIGAEIVPEAVENAQANARANGVENVSFLTGDAGAVAAKFAAEHLQPDVVVVDPPRKGLEDGVATSIAAMGPERVVYVSCNPGTLARDVKRFRGEGYSLVRAAAVDMFPRTVHVETVVMLSHKKPDGHINIKVEFGDGEDKVPLNNIAERAENYKPKERVTYKMIKEYIESKYGFKVHTAYIAEVKRALGLPMYDAPNAVEKLKQPRKHPTAEKVEAIKDALKHFSVI